ncbi:MAG: phosphoglycerate kinase [bacterium]|nr:phosphoglycerate kinase [bacterium]
MAKLFIENLPDLAGKLVSVRVDYNVPLKDGKVEDDRRIQASLPTVRFLQKQGARVVLMSHLGRPKGAVKDELRLAPVAARLGELLGAPIQSATDCVGPDSTAKVSTLKDGDVLLLENVRFHPEEEKNDADFAKTLAHGADYFVNDAFGTAHRAHASTEGITRFVQKSACGYIIRDELKYLGEVLANPERPYVAISGGAKISGKIDLIDSVLPTVDHLLIGGGMTYTFLKAQGHEIGKSLLEEDKVDVAKTTLEHGAGKLELPVDSLVATEIDFGARTVGELSTVTSEQMPADGIGLDIGPATIEHFRKIILNAKTVVWNGPMGVFEIDATSKGTFAIADALVEATKKGATTIVGGGDSAAAVEKAGLADQVSHVSTGGGATLEYLQGKVLPGVAALDEA